ncbi:MAG TPA: phage holin family protein [Acetobacteraceae bacterium]|nr:phage holin family protein [Acetobacteraceae bacterium]
MDEVRGTRTLREIVAEIARDAQDLIRGEIALARIELDRSLKQAIMAAIWLVGGMVVAFAGLVIFLLAAAAALAIVLPVWASLLIVGALILVVGGVLAYSGIKMLSPSGLMPNRLTRNVSEDARVVKEHI